jgi:hypothetical protein
VAALPGLTKKKELKKYFLALCPLEALHHFTAKFNGPMT